MLMQEFQIRPTVFVSKDAMHYHFELPMSSGVAWKWIHIQKLALRGHYGLCLGNLPTESETSSLAQVPLQALDSLIILLGAIVVHWLERFPRRRLMILGQTEVQNRLIRRVLNRSIEDWRTIWVIDGLLAMDQDQLIWQAFEPRGQYLAYSIRQRAGPASARRLE